MNILNNISDAFRKIFHKRSLTHSGVAVIYTVEERFEKILKVGEQGIVAMLNCSNDLLNYHFREICRYNTISMAI